MSDIRWDLLQPADIGGAFQGGLAKGVAMRRDREKQSALAAFSRDPTNPASVNALLAVDPALGMKASEYQTDMQKRATMGRLFEAPAQQPNALMTMRPEPLPSRASLSGSSPPPPFRMSPNGTPPIAPTPEEYRSMAEANDGVPAAPERLVDPAQLPPRTDGLKLNQEALRDLYRLDHSTAIQLQKHVFDSDAAQFKAMKDKGEYIASAAFHLKQTPAESRAQELQAMAPMLARMGIEPDALSQADLSDAGLDRYIRTGQSIGSILDDDRSDRRLDADIDDDEADNARADRNTDSVISDRGARRDLTARGQSLADRRGRRGQDIQSGDRRRAQDMTDRRTRESASFRGRGGKGGQRVTSVRSPDEARALPPGTMFKTPDGRVKVR